MVGQYFTLVYIVSLLLCLICLVKLTKVSSLFNSNRAVLLRGLPIALMSLVLCVTPTDLFANIEGNYQKEGHYYTQAEIKKLHDIAFVVYCEDRTDEKASMLVLSTIFNRADSYDINDMHKVVKAKSQYYCYKHKRKITEKERYNKIYQMCNEFIIFREKPITKAKYFYNHKQLKHPPFSRGLTKVLKHGAHTYLR